MITTQMVQIWRKRAILEMNSFVCGATKYLRKWPNKK